MTQLPRGTRFPLYKNANSNDRYISFSGTRGRSVHLRLDFMSARQDTNSEKEFPST